ncbi:MAG: ISNCY family transposase [Dehalococcoidales bacterium]|nr:ISNCY family transposase [Dehalococcoidales bacterium]
MTLKEQGRLIILNRVGQNTMSAKQAAEALGISLRHTRRLLAAYRKEGAQALAHGNRGRKPPNILDDDLRRKTVELARTTYQGFNNSHFTELLSEREGINLSRSTIRRILLGEGIRSPRKRRPPKHRSRRERYPREGMLLQIDGSRDDWLEGRGPYLTLIGAIDDATGIVPWAVFRYQEDAQGYVLLLQHIVMDYGVPEALYHDAHGIFERSKRDYESIEEQLEGKRRPTQFGRVMQELGITSITSRSPQSKGRIERLWGTFQDRLVSEMRLAGVKNLSEANDFLQIFLPRYNQRFAVSAREPGSAYRKVAKGFKPEEVFCFKYSRVAGMDNVVRFGNRRIQIMPSNGRQSYARARVEVQERMDGELALYYHGQCLATVPAPAEAPILRTKTNQCVNPAKKSEIKEPAMSVPATKPPKAQPSGRYKPGPNHPWRRRY